MRPNPNGPGGNGNQGKPALFRSLETSDDQANSLLGSGSSGSEAPTLARMATQGIDGILALYLLFFQLQPWNMTNMGGMGIFFSLFNMVLLGTTATSAVTRSAQSTRLWNWTHMAFFAAGIIVSAMYIEYGREYNSNYGGEFRITDYFPLFISFFGLFMGYLSRGGRGNSDGGQGGLA